MRLLIVTSVEKEARAIESADDVVIVVAGIGRTNAAAATTEAILKRGPFDAVLNVGVAGVLPGGGLTISDALVASACIYVEEGLVTAGGFAPLSSIGLELGDFSGNVVPVDSRLLDVLGERFAIGPIATVATCSGTDASAAEVVRRTGAIAEAMEGAAVVHTARRLRTPAIELRTISNTTGDRALQNWDLDAALEALGEAVAAAISHLRL
jgi:futalosine hydrolase